MNELLLFITVTCSIGIYFLIRSSRTDGKFNPKVKPGPGNIGRIIVSDPGDEMNDSHIYKNS